MAEPLYLSDSDNVKNIKSAIAHLEHARELLKRAGAPKSTQRVRLALTSTAGALRHAKRLANEASRENTHPTPSASGSARP